MDSTQSDNTDNCLFLLTLNVRGLGNNNKRKKIFAWLQYYKPHIVLLQETHGTCDIEKIWKAQWPQMNMYFSHDTTKAKGVAIFIHKDLKYEIIRSFSVENGRHLRIEGKLDDKNINLENIYAPNEINEQVIFYQKLSFVQRQLEETNFMGGDFNVTMNMIDRRSGVSGRAKIIDIIETLMSKNQLRDIWRYKNPNKRQYTWSREQGKNASRLDYWLITETISSNIQEVKILPTILTDHKIVSIAYNIKRNTEKGTGVWRMNDKHLQEQGYVDKIKEIITQVKQRDTNAINKWKEFKIKVRKVSREYGKQKALEIKAQSLYLSQKMMQLEQLQENEEPYQSLQNELEEFYEEKTNQATFRNTLNWMDKGEKNTKYFYGLEKRVLPPSGIHQIYNKDKKIIQGRQQVEAQLVQFWGDLFKKQIVPDLNILQEFKSNVKTITENTRKMINEELRLEELTESLFSMADDKSPGEDGITAKFYKTFWEDIKDEFFLYTKQLQKMANLPSNVGILRLIPKPKKDLLMPSSWRPICLQDVDLKIITKTIANRLKTVIEEVIHPDQIGFRGGQYIGQTIQLIQDIIECTEKEQKNAFLVSLDIEKAFDSVEWDYLDEIVKAMGIQGYLYDWIKLARSNMTIKINNNGWVSKPMTVSRGLKQGDPLSPYLFLISIEPLAQHIRNNTCIEGIKVHIDECKLSQYADDTTIYCANPNSLPHIINTVDRFYKISGYKNNTQKTAVLGLGTNKGVETEIHGLKVTKQITILGLEIQADLEKMREINIINKVTKMRQVFRIWSQRNLSLLGRIAIVKTLGISLLTYCMTNLDMPDYGLKALEKIIYEYIWQGKNKAKIKKSTLMAPLEKGGLKAPDIYTQNDLWKIKWVEKLCIPNKWNALIRRQLQKVGGIEYLINCNFDIEALPIRLRKFWTEVLCIFQNINCTEKVTNIHDIKTQIINNNQYVLIGGKSFFKQKLVDAEIDKVEDWIHWNNTWKSWENLKEKCPSLTCMEYNQIKSAVPKHWIKILQQRVNWGADRQILISEKMQIKQLLNNTRIQKPTCVEVWENEQKNNIKQYINWVDQYSAFQKVFVEPRLKSFQYLLMNKRITTKKERMRYKLIDKNECHFCKKEEDFDHMFLECPGTLRLWERLKNKLLDEYRIDMIVNKENVIFLQNTQDKRRDAIINATFIWGKHFIYKASIQNNKLEFDIFWKEVECRLKMMEIIARKNKRLTKFESIWKQS